jgi:predicted O-methyltransferase YrrM
MHPGQTEAAHRTRESRDTAGTPRHEQLFALARAAEGFMPDDEGQALYAAALRAGRSAGSATFVEVGAWCGKSTVYLGAAAEDTGAVLFSLDHHHGSEENQPGWEHHDPGLIDPGTGRIDTLPHWRRTIGGADLERTVVGLVGDSPVVAGRWTTPLDFCFIDGGHGAEPAWADYRGWSPHVRVGGLLAIHDVFPDPADGGRPPYDLWRHALDSGAFGEESECGSLRVLTRIEPAG